MKLSKKKSQELYNIIHEEIMQTRMSLLKHIKGFNIDAKLVDDYLSKLNFECPRKAIEFFNNDKK